MNRNNSKINNQDVNKCKNQAKSSIEKFVCSKSPLFYYNKNNYLDFANRQN